MYIIRQIEASIALLIVGEEDIVTVLKLNMDVEVATIEALSELYLSVRSARLLAVLHISLIVGGNFIVEFCVVVVWERRRLISVSCSR